MKLGFKKNENKTFSQTFLNCFGILLFFQKFGNNFQKNFFGNVFSQNKFWGNFFSKKQIRKKIPKIVFFEKKTVFGKKNPKNVLRNYFFPKQFGGKTNSQNLFWELFFQTFFSIQITVPAKQNLKCLKFDAGLRRSFFRNLTFDTGFGVHFVSNFEI